MKLIKHLLTLKRFMLYTPLVALSLFAVQIAFDEPPYRGIHPDAPALDTCTQHEIFKALDSMPLYQQAGLTGFVRVQDGRFEVDGSTFTARGVNYYPSRFPWRRFLGHLDFEAIRQEFGLLRAAGVNTLRIFLWNEALFQCPGSGAIPKVDVFARLDRVIALAAEHNFRLIVTLNDLPDLEHYPLYADPEHTRKQTAYIVKRYRNEAAILAWDVRNEGDIDYGSNNALALGNRFPRQQVLDWLVLTTVFVRQLDSNHLLTAGWLHDAQSTAELVDFVSFHHWWDANNLRQRLNDIRVVTDKPVLLEEFGYSTFRMSEDDHARLIYEGILAAENEGTLGWLVWTAFDFPLDATCIPPACPSQDNAEHHFGLWRTDYTPKPAAGILIDLFGMK